MRLRLLLALGGLTVACASATSTPAPSTPPAAAPEKQARAPKVAAPPEPKSAPDVSDLAPAGCGVRDDHLYATCPRSKRLTHAVLLGSTERAADAEALLAKAQRLELPAGYPLVLSYGELILKDPRQGLAVVAGLFYDPQAAIEYRQHLPDAELVELGSPEQWAERDEVPEDVVYQDHMAKYSVAIELREDTAAWSRAALDDLEHALDERLAQKWVRLPEQYERREAALAQLTPQCHLARGRVFVTNRRDMYDFQRLYAPVQCDDGRTAWVPWRATRLESVVTRDPDGAKVHQVMLVECDRASTEVRRYERESSGKLVRLDPPGPC